MYGLTGWKVARQDRKQGIRLIRVVSCIRLRRAFRQMACGQDRRALLEKCTYI